MPVLVAWISPFVWNGKKSRCIHNILAVVVVSFCSFYEFFGLIMSGWFLSGGHLSGHFDRQIDSFMKDWQRSRLILVVKTHYIQNVQGRFGRRPSKLCNDIAFFFTVSSIPFPGDFSIFRNDISSPWMLLSDSIICVQLLSFSSTKACALPCTQSLQCFPKVAVVSPFCCFLGRIVSRTCSFQHSTQSCGWISTQV